MPLGNGGALIRSASGGERCGNQFKTPVEEVHSGGGGDELPSAALRAALSEVDRCMAESTAAMAVASRLKQNSVRHRRAMRDLSVGGGVAAFRVAVVRRGAGQAASPLNSLPQGFIDDRVVPFVARW